MIKKKIIIIQKNLHVDPMLPNGCLQKIDYRYNERGWLTSINNSALIDDNGVTNDDDFDAFGEQLTYANSNAFVNVFSVPKAICARPVKRTFSTSHRG